MHRRSARARRIYTCSSGRRKRPHRSALCTAAVRCVTFLCSAFLSALNVIEMVLNKYTFCARVCNQICSPPVTHAYQEALLRSPRARSARRPCSHVRRRRRQRRWSGGSRVDLLTLSSQSVCLRGETPTDVRIITHNRTQPHAHLGTRR